MKLHKKFIAAALAAVLSVSATSGCHGSHKSDEFEIPQQFDESKPVEITFWAKNDTNKTQTGIYKQAIEDFQAIYPNITVNMRLYTDYVKIYNDVITNIPTETTPNVCITYPDHIATYMTGANTVVQLDELMTDEQWGLGGSAVKFAAPTFDQLIPEYIEECKLGGHYRAVPFMRSSEACYINKDMVEKLGYTLPETLTWDFVWEVSEAATAKDSDGIYKVNGQKVMIPFIYKSSDNMMITMLKQLGAGYSDDSGTVTMFNDTSKRLLTEISAHVKSGAFSTFKISGYPGNFLNAGQCIFAIDSTAGATWMGTEASHHDISEDTIIDFETVVMPIPQYDTEHPQMISQGPSVCIFTKRDPQVVLASWLFMQYLLTDKVQTAYAGTEGYIPVTSTARNSDEYRDYLSRSGEDSDLYYSVKIDATKMLLGNIENTFTAPVFNGSASLRSAASQLIESTAKSTRRGEAIDDAYFDKLFAETSSLYRLSDNAAAGKVELGALPDGAVALLVTLGLAWVGIICYVLISRAVKKKHSGK